jgi:hypothetical protein
MISNDPDDPIMISNDPDDPAMANDSNRAKLRAAKQAQMEAKKTQTEKLRAAVNRREPVTDILTPVVTIIDTRSAHGVLGIDELRIALKHELSNCKINETKIRVWPQLDGKSNGARAVSMSWWLSPPVQLHLHQQTEPDKNEKYNNEDRQKAVWDALSATSSTCGKP